MLFYLSVLLDSDNPDDAKASLGVTVNDITSDDADASLGVSVNDTSHDDDKASNGITMDDITADDAKASLGVTVTMNITNIGTQGYPGTGKTSILDLAMGKEPAPQRNSTQLHSECFIRFEDFFKNRLFLCNCFTAIVCLIFKCAHDCEFCLQCQWILSH